MDVSNKHAKALYSLLMVLAAVDREFDEAENDFILNVVRRVCGEEPASAEFVQSMGRDFEAAMRSRKALTQEYFDSQARQLADLSAAAKQRILQVMRSLARADGRATHRERYLLDKLATALGLDPDKDG